MRKATGYVAILVAAVVLVGCAGNVVRRPVVAEVECLPSYNGQISKEEAVQKQCRQRSVEIGPGYKLAVLELDDQGRFRQDQQMKNLFKLLGDEMDKAKRGDTGGVSLVVFVHGWRHDADVNDPNLEFARTVLLRTVFVENQIPQYTPYGNERTGKPRSVVGVYVGWRGKSLTGPGFLNFLEVLSFWDRKFTAERVATGSVRELFARLKYFRDSSNARALEATKDPKAPCVDIKPGLPPEATICPAVRLFIVGHSFGGLLVYNALSESLIRSVTEAEWGGGRQNVVGEYADLVVLVNPAVEGARFEPLHQAVLRREYNSGQLPIFVSITATNDWATGLAFPFGRWFNTLFENESPGNRENPADAERIGREEREANVHAMGHIERYKTHVLCLAVAGPDACPPAQRTAANGRLKSLVEKWATKVDAIADPEKRANCLSALQEQLAKNYLDGKKITWDTGTDVSGQRVRFREFLGTERPEETDLRTLKLSSDGLTLRVHKSLEKEIADKNNTSLISTPAWIIESNDTRIIDGHNDFTRQPFRDFLVQLYHDRVMYGRSVVLDPEDTCR